MKFIMYNVYQMKKNISQSMQSEDLDAHYSCLATD